MDGKRTSLELYQTHRATLLSYATRLSGDKTVAEDIVQDVWLLFSRQRVETIAVHLDLSLTRVHGLIEDGMAICDRVRKEGQ